MEPLDHLAVQLYRAPCLIFRRIERADDQPRPGDRGVVRREGPVTDGDLARVYQRLAVEAEQYGLPRLGFKTLIIVEPVVDAVQDQQPVRARCGHGQA